MSNFPQRYGDPLYLKTCKEISGYDFPEDKWSGATLLLRVEDGLNLIKRSSTMPTHANQVACFGGKRGPNENDPLEVARREFNEETGIANNQCEFIGLLPPVYAARQTIIIPVVERYIGTSEQFKKIVKSNGEWDFGFHIKIKDLKNEKNWRYGERIGNETASQILFYDLESSGYCVFGEKKPEDKAPVLWGATARMVWNYLSMEQNKE